MDDSEREFVGSGSWLNSLGSPRFDAIPAGAIERDFVAPSFRRNNFSLPNSCHLELNPLKTSNPSPRPRKTLIASLVFLVILVGLRWNANGLHAQWRWDPAIINFMSFAIFQLVLLFWAIWLAVWGFRTRLRGVLAGLVVLFLPVAFFLLARPVLDGDLGIARFDGVWFKTVTAEGAGGSQAEIPTGGTADLTVRANSDFPQFLGAQRNGTTPAVVADLNDRTLRPVELWRRKVGLGWSGCASVNGYLVTQEQDQALECVSCFRLADGQRVWQYSHPQRHEDLGGLGKAGPRATPTIDSGRVYAQGAAGQLVCLEGATGRLIWKQDLCELLGIELQKHRSLAGLDYQFENSSLSWGRAASPLVVDSLVYVPGGGPTGGPYSTLLAFDKVTGELRWKAGDEMIGYGSPSWCELEGIPQIVLVAERTAMGFDPQTGRQLWAHQRPGSSQAAANCSQATLVSPNQLLLTKGYGLGGELVQFDLHSGDLKVRSLWKSPRVLTTKFSNPVIADGYAYALADGFLECVEVETGRLVWSLRAKFGHGQLLLAGDRLIVHSEFGRLGIFPARPVRPDWTEKFETIDGLCWNTLCLVGDRLVVRSDLEMACYQLQPEPALSPTAAGSLGEPEIPGKRVGVPPQQASDK